MPHTKSIATPRAPKTCGRSSGSCSFPWSARCWCWEGWVVDHHTRAPNHSQPDRAKPNPTCSVRASLGCSASSRAGRCTSCNRTRPARRQTRLWTCRCFRAVRVGLVLLPVQLAATLARRARTTASSGSSSSRCRAPADRAVHALNGHARVACAGEILNRHYRVYGDVSDAPSSVSAALRSAARRAAALVATGPRPSGSRRSTSRSCRFRRGPRVGRPVSRRPARVILPTPRDRAGFVRSRARTARAFGISPQPAGRVRGPRLAAGRARRGRARRAAPAVAADAAELREHCERTRAAWREIEMVELAAHDDRRCVPRLYHEEPMPSRARASARVDFLGVPSRCGHRRDSRAAVSRRCAGGRSAGGLPPAEHAFEYAGRKLNEGS